MPILFSPVRTLFRAAPGQLLEKHSIVMLAAGAVTATTHSHVVCVACRGYPGTQRLAYLVTGIRLKGYYIMDAYTVEAPDGLRLCPRSTSWNRM
jgi:hypothetical protein